MTIRIVGLDLSLASTGVAQLGYTSGAWTHSLYQIRTTPHRRGDHADLADRLGRIRGECGIAAEHADLVVLEGLGFAAKGAATRDLAGAWWLVYDRLLRGEHKVLVVPPTALKKWATGKGRADKADMGVAVGRMWPEVELRGNDQIDALGLASMGAQFLGLEVPFPLPAYRDLGGVYVPDGLEAA